MVLPVSPPVTPMLAKLQRDLPIGEQWRYEPKFDGFRALAFRDGVEVDIRSRNHRPFARYFPEVVEALLALSAERVVLDGELVAVSEGAFDFSALMLRLHPSKSRVDVLRQSTPAQFLVFDVLALGDDDLTELPFVERRAALESVVASAGEDGALQLVPSTDDAGVATEWLDRLSGNGIDGVVAKAVDMRYEPGRRGMVKVKRERTADCVVGGFRVFPGDPPALASLLLGLYDDAGSLRHVGVASSFSEARRRELVLELFPSITPLEGHPWEAGFALEGGPMGRLKGAAGQWRPDMEHDWVPVRPELVCEVAYDRVDAGRWRHPARFVRWRPDRDPRSCSLAQLAP
ncbi:MAG: ATP-dependent DNA ligase [Actinobacteria bacterium]|nr:ATP-dependent DNA ligase [Actinomycetota bacterium]